MKQWCSDFHELCVNFLLLLKQFSVKFEATNQTDASNINLRVHSPILCGIFVPRVFFIDYSLKDLLHPLTGHNLCQHKSLPVKRCQMTYPLRRTLLCHLCLRWKGGGISSLPEMALPCLPKSMQVILTGYFPQVTTLPFLERGSVSVPNILFPRMRYPRVPFPAWKRYLLLSGEDETPGVSLEEDAWWKRYTGLIFVEKFCINTQRNSQSRTNDWIWLKLPVIQETRGTRNGWSTERKLNWFGVAGKISLLCCSPVMSLESWFNMPWQQ